MQGLDLFVVRHGESMANREGYLTATPPGPGLTELGHRQSQAVARLLLTRSATPKAIATSPYTRTRATAEPLAQVLGLHPVDLTGLSETRFGEWEGQHVSDLSDLPTFSSWRTDPERFPPPAGERISEVAGRALVGIDDFTRGEEAGPVVAYAHQQVIAGLYLKLNRLPWNAYRTLGVPNCAILHLRRTHDGWQVLDLYRLRPPYSLRLPMAWTAEANA